jgi:hypothetical protein
VKKAALIAATEACVAAEAGILLQCSHAVSMHGWCCMLAAVSAAAATAVLVAQLLMVQEMHNMLELHILRCVHCILGQLGCSSRGASTTKP